MALDQAQLEKTIRKLRKLLKNMPKQPSPEQVHDLRTRIRRLEAITHALMLDRQREGRRLLNVTTSIRRRAGQVRDMDVLTGFASTINVNSEDQCRVQL